MKEIPCKPIEVLKGTKTYDKLLDYIKTYRLRSLPGLVLSVIFFPSIALFTIILFLLLYFFVGDKIAIAVRGLSAVFSPACFQAL